MNDQNIQNMNERVRDEIKETDSNVVFASEEEVAKAIDNCNKKYGSALKALAAGPDDDVKF